jgi:heptosyltransferase-2
LQSQVSLLVKKNSRAEQLCKNDQHIKEIIYLDRNKNNSGKHDGWIGFFNLLKEIKEKKFDKIFIFNGYLRFLLLAKLCGIKSILQYPLFTRKNNIVLTAKNFTEKFTENTISTQPRLYLKEDVVKEVKKKYNFK